MYVVIVDFKIKPERLDEFMPLMLENARASRETEPGCRVFDVCVDPKDKTRIMLYEVYNDEAAFEEHQKGAAFKKYVAEAVPLLADRVRNVWKRVSP